MLNRDCFRVDDYEDTSSMISVDESAEWSPHGREVVGRHPPQHYEDSKGEEDQVRAQLAMFDISN